jgi:predicted nucleic acid-binding protein
LSLPTGTLSNPIVFQNFVRSITNRLRPDADPRSIEGALDDVDKTFTFAEAVAFLETTADPRFAFVRELFQEVEVDPLTERLREDIETIREQGISDRSIAAALRRAGLELERPTSAGLNRAREEIQQLREQLTREKEEAARAVAAVTPGPPPGDILDVRVLPARQLDAAFGMIPDRARLIENTNLLPRDFFFFSPSRGTFFLKTNGTFFPVTTATIISRLERAMRETVEAPAPAVPLTDGQIDLLNNTFVTRITVALGRTPFTSEIERFELLLETARRERIPFGLANQQIIGLADVIVRERGGPIRAAAPTVVVPALGAPIVQPSSVRIRFRFADGREEFSGVLARKTAITYARESKKRDPTIGIDFVPV